MSLTIRLPFLHDHSSLSLASFSPWNSLTARESTTTMSAVPSRQSASASQNSSGSPKKRRLNTVQEIFEKPDRDVVKKQLIQYRELLEKAEGQYQFSLPYAYHGIQAECTETKSDLANRTLKDLRTTLKIGDALFDDGKLLILSGFTDRRS